MYSNTNSLNLFNWKIYGDKLRDISNYFPAIKNTKIKINAEIDAILIPPGNENKTYLNTLFANGPMGAEKIQDKRGKPKIVLVDILSYKNIDLKAMGYGARRIYLEALFNDIKPVFEASGADIRLSQSISEDKRKFFDWITQHNGKGIVLKNRHSHYVSGIGRDSLEVRNTRWQNENISLTNEWVEETKDKNIFDFDEYLAIQALDKMDL